MKTFFRKNEHPLDRAIRVTLGIALLSLIYIGPQTLWGLVGLVPLVTGLFGFCPIYSAFGLSTSQGDDSTASFP